jgi:hypothetical protein
MARREATLKVMAARRTRREVRMRMREMGFLLVEASVVGCVPGTRKIEALRVR